MISKKDRLQALHQQIEEIINKIREIETNYTEDIENVHPIYSNDLLGNDLVRTSEC